MQLLSSTSTTTSITAMMIMRASLALLSVRPCTSKLDVETCPVWISKMVLAQHFGTVVWMHLHQCSVSHPTKIFLTSKFSYLLFLNPTHKTKTETANMWENTNSNLIDQSNYLANHSGVTLCWSAFYQPLHPVQKSWAKLIIQFDFSSSNFFNL